MKNTKGAPGVHVETGLSALPAAFLRGRAAAVNSREPGAGRGAEPGFV